jgi:succinoglycan biosynthesis protein ExoA
MSAPETQGAEPSSILVAIPTLNEEKHIAATLTALMSDNPRMEAVKIVVADGGSTDRTRDIVAEFAARHPNIHLIDNPQKLQSAAVNKVVEDCAEPQHEILVRVDAHSIYPPNYVLSVADSLIAHDVAALATVMDSVGDSCFQRGSAWASHTKVGSGGSGHRGGTTSGYVDHGHHAGFRLDMWRKVGGYNVAFVANEDAELDHRITQAGGKIWLDATIRLDYVMRDSLRKLARQYWRYGIGRAQNILQHGMRPKLRQVVPPIFVLANGLGVLVSPLCPATLVLPGIYLLILLAVSLQLLLKHRSLCALWAGPALIAMHHAWGAGFILQMLRGRGSA